MVADIQSRFTLAEAMALEGAAAFHSEVMRRHLDNIGPDESVARQLELLDAARASLRREIEFEARKQAEEEDRLFGWSENMMAGSFGR